MTIVVGGQLERQQIAQLLTQHGGGQVQVTIKSDIEAAMAVKLGQAQYYFGACNTGGGGALAMAIALLGTGNCLTVGMPGKQLSEAEIIAAVNAGKKAFGFTAQDTHRVVPLIMQAILAQT